MPNAVVEKLNRWRARRRLQTVTRMTADHRLAGGAYLETDAEGGEERRPGHLEHGPDVVRVRGRLEAVAHVRHRLHELARRRRQRLHFHVPEQPALLLVGHGH